jgi:O-antigen/teichoic acid export membrane protein
LLGGHFLATSVFRVPASFADEAVFVVTGAAAAFFITLLSGIFGSLIQGLQRMDLWNASLVAYTVLDMAGAVTVLALGYGLRALVLSRILSCLAIGLLNTWVAHRIIPTLRCRPWYFSLESGREIIGYSLNILVSKVATMAREPLSKTIILPITSLSGVAFFDLGARLANQARGVFTAMLVPLLPAASGVQAAGGSQATRQLYYRSTRYVVLLVFPLFGGLAILAKPIIDLWIGPEYGFVVLTLQGLLLAYFFALLSSPAYTIMEGVGLARVSALSSVVSAVLNVGLSIGLGRSWGYVGVLAGYCLAIIITSIVTLALFHHMLTVPLGELVSAMPLRAVLIDCCAMVVSGLLVVYIDLHGILTLAIVGMIYFALCIFGTLAFGALYEEEMGIMKRLWAMSAK